MLPIQILREAMNKKVLVELKSGEVVTGELRDVDQAMNLIVEGAVRCHLQKKVVKTARECFIRGTQVYFIHIPDEVLDRVGEIVMKQRKAKEMERRMGLQQGSINRWN
ncbi:hypothetical protein RUND412_003265 [Rhizina undulata]